jgi:outer membrane receptor protein involved in Fe transport
LPGARHALDVLTATAPHHQERTETEWSGVATLAWEVEENLNTYATYSRGYKAGGFNLDRSFSDAGGSIVIGPAPNTVIAGVVTPNPLFLVPQTVRGPDTSFPAEFVDAYELGLKTILADGNLFINTAIFYQEFENFQLNTFTGVSFIVTPIPGVISQGVEIETAWTTPIEGLSTNLSLQYTDAHYDGLGSLTTPGSFIALNPGLFLLADAQITHAPKWAVTGGFDYDFRLFNHFAAIFHMDARWQSEMNTGSNLDPRKLQQAFALVGMKFGIYTDNERYGLEFFARNLFDEKYINTAFDSPLQGSAISPTSPGGVGTSTIDAFLGEPRMMGATFRVRY